MKVVIEKSFIINTPSVKELEQLKRCTVYFSETSNPEEISIMEQKITLEPEDMEQILDIFSYNGASISLLRYDNARYQLI